MELNSTPTPLLQVSEDIIVLNIKDLNNTDSLHGLLVLYEIRFHLRNYDK